MGRRFAWSRTTSGTRISRSAPFTCSTAASSRRRRKHASEPNAGRQFMEAIWQDVRFGLRMLGKHRLATAVCIIALGLGIGANAAMFSLAEAFLLHPVPFDNSERIVALVAAHAQGGNTPSVVDRNGVAPATFFDWKKEAHSYEELAAYQWDEVNLTGDREPQKIQSI